MNNLDDIQTRPLNSCFSFINSDGSKTMYRVTDSENKGCGGCDLFEDCEKEDQSFLKCVGDCHPEFRTDKKDVVFKKIDQ